MAPQVFFIGTPSFFHWHPQFFLFHATPMHTVSLIFSAELQTEYEYFPETVIGVYTSTLLDIILDKNTSIVYPLDALSNSCT